MILASLVAWALAQESAYIAVSDCREVAFCVILEAGSALDPDGKSGATHIVEHLLFRRGDAGSLDFEMEALGGRVEATTYRDFMRIWVTVPREVAVRAASVLSRILQPESWSDATIAQEQTLVLQELRLRELVPDSLLRERLWHAVFGSSPFGRPSGGMPEEIAKLSPDEVRTWARQILQRRVTVVAVGGDAPGIGDALMGLQRASGLEASEKSWPIPDRAARIEQDGYVAVGLALPRGEDASAYAAGQIAVEALAGKGDSLAARLGLAMEPIWEPAGAACLAGVVYRQSKAQEGAEAIRQGANLTDAEIERARAVLLRQWERSLAEIESRAFWEAFARAWGLRDAQAFVHLTKNVRPEAVREVLVKMAAAG